MLAKRKGVKGSLGRENMSKGLKENWGQVTGTELVRERRQAQDEKKE